MKSRNWVFTINNFTVEDASEWNCDQIKFMIFQEEEGETGTKHLQGYLELKTARGLPYMKRLKERAHWEVRRGTREEAIKYCVKEDRLSNPIIYHQGEFSPIGHGELSEETCMELLCEKGILKEKKKTKKEDMLEVKKMLDDGSTFEDIADFDFDLWCRHYKAFERYLLMKTTPRNHEVKVLVLQGPTGTGKSKYCIEQFPDGYWKQRSNWWDGYSKQSTIIIDEFYGWLPFDLLLRLCDRYPLMLETKGGQVQCIADTIIITSNKRPDMWYNNVYFDAFKRRVHMWMVMPEVGKCNHYPRFEDAEFL